MKNYSEKAQYLYNKQGGRCASCNKILLASDKMELAHKIPAYKFNYSEYGEEVIDHVLNLGLTHDGKCNDKQNLSLAAHPMEGKALIKKIEEEINESKQY